MATTTRRVVLLIAIWALATGAAERSCAAERLSEKSLVTLIELDIGGQAIVNKIRKDGIEFSVSKELLDRLKKAGASNVVLSALRATSKSKKKAANGKAITYKDVLGLVKLGIEEEAILKRLAKSPTLFVLDSKQEQELKSAGASDRLIAAMKGKRRPPEQAHDITDFAVILDCSGSMKEHTKDGQAKMTVAKKVVAGLIRKIPSGLNLTFIIYGHDRKLECRAVKIARPLSELDETGKSRLAGTIAKLKPAGATPIALALRTAGKELAKNDAYCGLVLISDGKETCMGDPAGEAARLAKNLKLTFGAHVIGFDVDAEGRTQLEQVATVTGGKYYDARNADELDKALNSIKKQIEKVAPEKPSIELVKSPFSAVQLSPFALEGVIGIKEAYIVAAGQNPTDYAFDTDSSIILQRTTDFKAPMPISAGKYDIVCRPAKGRKFTLIRNLEVKPRRLTKINTNKVVGVIAVKDPMFAGLEAKKLYVVRVGEKPNAADFLFQSNNRLQECDGFGETMLVTAGREYDIVLEPTKGQRVTIAEKIVPKAGKLTTVGGEEDER